MTLIADRPFRPWTAATAEGAIGEGEPTSD